MKEAAERFRERTGHYPERILADQIYRTRENRKYCKMHGIRLSGPKLGRPGLEKQPAKEKKQEPSTDIEAQLEAARERLRRFNEMEMEEKK